jgi:hypothetical protein
MKRAVIMEGYMSDGNEESPSIPVNDISIWHKILFFKHVESALELGAMHLTLYRPLVFPVLVLFVTIAC